MTDKEEYGLSPQKKTQTIEPPIVDYLPPTPKQYNPGIALIGTGGISEFHLKNYKSCGYRVVALANRNLNKAEEMRDKFTPMPPCIKIIKKYWNAMRWRWWM